MPDDAAHQGPRFFGKYRGKVADNLDPLMLGRIVAQVPAVSSAASNWALPCVPYAGPQTGVPLMPPVGANVWIEFEAGDPDYPIWTGCFWSPGDLPEPVPESTPSTRAPDPRDAELKP
jgi:hypothetical protein